MAEVTLTTEEALLLAALMQEVDRRWERAPSSQRDDWMRDTVKAVRVRLLDGHGIAQDAGSSSVRITLGEDEARLVYGLVSDTLSMNPSSAPETQRLQDALGRVRGALPGEESRTGWRERRRLKRIRQEGESRARTLEIMRRELRETDEFIANEKAAIRENTDFERGTFRLPSPALLAAVNNRERIADVVADLEHGAPLGEVNKKLQVINRDFKDWERRARR